MNHKTLVRNLTGHALVIRSAIEGPDGPIDYDVTLHPDGPKAVVATTDRLVGHVTGQELPVYDVAYGEIENLPDPEDGVLFAVSAIVLAAGLAIGRTDLVAPKSDGTAIRNEKGHIVAVRGFRRG